MPELTIFGDVVAFGLGLSVLLLCISLTCVFILGVLGSTNEDSKHTK